MTSYKADGTIVRPTPRDPDIKPQHGGEPKRNSLSAAELDAVHRQSADIAAAKRTAKYLGSPEFGAAVLARLDALEAKVAELEGQR